MGIRRIRCSHYGGMEKYAVRHLLSLPVLSAYVSSQRHPSHETRKCLGLYRLWFITLKQTNDTWTSFYMAA